MIETSEEWDWEDIRWSLDWQQHCRYQIRKTLLKIWWTKQMLRLWSMNWVTYILSTFLRKGNHFFNWSRCVRPWTRKTGIRNRRVSTMHATMTTSFKIHLLKNEAEKKGQWISSGSGAFSGVHSVGLTPCWMCKAVAAPYRDLKQTNAAAW